MDLSQRQQCHNICPSLWMAIAIITKTHGLPTGGGHIAGKDNLDPLVEHCMDIGNRALTVFGFLAKIGGAQPVKLALLSCLSKPSADQLPRMRHQISFALYRG